MVTHSLRRRGYRTHTARNVGEAVIMAENIEDVAVVVSDLSAPFLSTEEIVVRLRAASRGASIVLTLDFAADLGVPATTVIKPFDASDLLIAVRSAADLHLNAKQNA